ncbi:MAG: hypothetical protein IS632_03825 [Thaumarchaeota archaeon]|nr:hypothetical protein [Nitrososphaerota archaeon]
MDSKLDASLENDAQSLGILRDLHDGGLLRVPLCRALGHLLAQMSVLGSSAHVAGGRAAAACPAPWDRASRPTIVLAAVRACGLQPQWSPESTLAGVLAR